MEGRGRASALTNYLSLRIMGSGTWCRAVVLKLRLKCLNHVKCWLN